MKECEIRLTIQTLTVIAACAALGACSHPQQGTSTPLSQITGDSLSFAMCGKNIRLRKAAIGHFTSNGVEGLSHQPITEVYMHLNLHKLNDLPSSEITPTVLAVIACQPTRASSTYAMRETAFISSQDFPELGLRRKDLARHPAQLNSYYFSLEEPESPEQFFLACQRDINRDLPVSCEIKGTIRETIAFRIDFGAGKTLRNWRIYRNIFEIFVVAEN